MRANKERGEGRLGEF